MGTLHIWDIEQQIIGPSPASATAKIDDRLLQATSHSGDEKKRTAAAAAAALAIMSAGVSLPYSLL
jgi:hypothetical protein